MSIRLTLINRSKTRAPRKFLERWLNLLGKEKVFRSSKHSELVVVLVGPAEMKTLNGKYRRRNYATDVLSFESTDPEVVGELVICPQVISRQAREHGLLVREEFGYMLLHGLLHLRGYDHERSERAAKKMFGLQDEIFERLLTAFSR